jgi:Reverse transcriptase (RNA-dependent DNA polymerase)
MEFVNINFVAKEIWIPLDFVTRQEMVEEKVLVDCGANENCIDIKTAQKLGVKPRLLPEPMCIRNVDGTDNRGRIVKYWLPVAVFQGDRARMLKFLIVDLGRDRIILGYPWFREFNPEINWPKKFVKGPPFLAADTTIAPGDLITHARTFTRRRYLNPNGQAFIRHMTEEYEDEDPRPGQKESHTFITTYEPRKHRSAPLPEGAAERVKNELNRVERHLDLTKTAQHPSTTMNNDDFAKTIKEQQARKLLETQFTQMPNELTIGTQEQRLEKLMNSSPLTKLAQLKEENRQRRIQNHLDIVETSLTPSLQNRTPPDTLPPKPSQRFQQLEQIKEIRPNIDKAHRMLAEVKQKCMEARIAHLEEQVNSKPKTPENTRYPTPPTTPEEPRTRFRPRAPSPLRNDGTPKWGTTEINRTTAATQWAIDAQKDKTKETQELPPHYNQHWRVFSEKLAQRFPLERRDDHAIKLRPGAPDTIPSRAYKWTPEEDKVGREWLKENEDLGYIEKGDSPWATPCFFVKKKDGKLRPVQDYRVINKWTIPNIYPLPQIKTILEQLEGKALFTTLDIHWGYNNIRINQDDQWKAAFITPYGLYIPKVMPFGLRNAPATFQHCMHNTFQDILNRWPENILIYMDDFLVTTPNKTQQDIQLHRTIVHAVLQCFEDQSFFLKAAKCHFEQTKVNYLGIVVEDGKITLDPIKQ